MRLSRQRRTSPAALQSCTIHTGTLVSIWLPGSAVVSWSSAALEPGLLTHGRLWGRLELSVQWDTGNSHQAAMLPSNRPMFSELASPVAARRALDPELSAARRLSFSDGEVDTGTCTAHRPLPIAFLDRWARPLYGPQRRKRRRKILLKHV